MIIKMPSNEDISDNIVRNYAEFVESHGYLLIELRDLYWGDGYSFEQWNFYFAIENLTDFWSVFQRDVQEQGQQGEWPKIGFKIIFDRPMFVIQCNMNHIKYVE